MGAAIQEVKAIIKQRRLERGAVLPVGRRFGLKVQWEMMCLSPLTGDIAWLKANRPDYEHPNVEINGVRLTWPRKRTR